MSANKRILSDSLFNKKAVSDWVTLESKGDSKNKNSLKTISFVKTSIKCIKIKPQYSKI
ncbi:MAG: hypothetical protein H7339_05355 [Arcicella sp.]|nr:hypothetical protein [Arcicella sp.]